MTLNRAASQNGIQAESQADVFGVVCSVGCAIHCAATPILLSALPSISALQWLADPLFHQVVAVVCAALVVRAILPGWQLHRSRSVAMFAVSGISLLFAAAFILPDTCCDQHHVASANLQQPADLEVLVGNSNAATGMAICLVSHPSVKADAHELSIGCVHAHGPVQSRATQVCVSCDHAQALQSESCAEMAECSICPTVVLHQASTWSHPLLTEENLQATLGRQVAEKLLTAQPYLSPFGGVLLIVAHLLNIRLRGCGSATCRTRKPNCE